MSAFLSVGYFGSDNRLLITDGAAVNNPVGYLGFGRGGSNNVVVVRNPNSAWNVSSFLAVGGEGSFNTLIITNGATVTNLNGSIGFQQLARFNAAIVSGPGSVWHGGDELTVGLSGNDNTMIITNGGMVTNIYGTVGCRSDLAAIRPSSLVLVPRGTLVTF